MLEKKDDGSLSGIEFKDSLYEDFAQYDLLAEAEKVSCVLVIHGEMDEVVPAREGKAIYEHAKEPKQFELIKGADHIFSVPGHRERAITLSLDWFRRFLLSLVSLLSAGQRHGRNRDLRRPARPVTLRRTVQYACGLQGSQCIDTSSIPPCRRPPDPAMSARFC